MQDVALVGRRLPMLQVQPGQVQQRRPRGQVSGPLGVDGDKRQCAEAGRAEAGLASGMAPPRPVPARIGPPPEPQARTEDGLVGEVWVSTCRYRRMQYN